MATTITYRRRRHATTPFLKSISICLCSYSSPPRKIQKIIPITTNNLKPKSAEGVTEAEIRNNPDLVTYPGGISASMAAAAKLNQDPTF